MSLSDYSVTRVTARQVREALRRRASDRGQRTKKLVVQILRLVPADRTVRQPESTLSGP
jgi:hypothetical protein